jgi:predicted ABC-type ATPase
MAQMIVVAGPPGGGKFTVMGSHYFSDFAIPYFNIDERCKQIHGSAQKIPPGIRQQANDELRNFCEERIQGRQTFGFETTLRADFAIRMAHAAQKVGIATELHYIAAAVETHIERVTARAIAGGHAASEPRLREMYIASLENLPRAMNAFDHCLIYDSSGPSPILRLETKGPPNRFRQGAVVAVDRAVSRKAQRTPAGRATLMGCLTSGICENKSSRVRIPATGFSL